MFFRAYSFTDIFDPTMIGDKSKWFSDQLPNVHHSTHEKCATLVATVTMADELINHRESDAPTDESGKKSCLIHLPRFHVPCSVLAFYVFSI